MVNGAPSTNPRYLQPRPDLTNPRDSYLAEIAARLAREIPAARPVYQPVNAVLAGRRNSPADPKAGTPPLAVYGPVHYQELPELFMDFIASLTGKSPATTGFGSEGALTKGPFNALWPVVDLNNALVSAIVTGYAGFTTSAGYAGPNFRVDHDVSLLVPEIWCRMRVHERDPEFLKAHGYLEQVCDFCLDGRTVLASRLGYRITELFVDHFLGRIFETPDAVFPDQMLRPEKQDLAQFAAGVDAIVETQTRVALQYFEDGSVDAACPPLKALLHIMAHGSYEGRGVDAPEIRGLFTREAMLAERLVSRALSGEAGTRRGAVDAACCSVGGGAREWIGHWIGPGRSAFAIGASERAGVFARTGRDYWGRSVPFANLAAYSRARFSDYQMNEVQFCDRRARQRERIEIGLAHAARQFVQHRRECDPGVEEREKALGAGVVGPKQSVAAERVDFHFQAASIQAEAERGIESVHHVQIVRPGFRPVFPGMHAGVGADMPLFPAGQRALLVVALQRRGVILLLVAE